MNSRKFAIPPKQARRILSESERKYIAYQNDRHLWLTPKIWQKHYMQIWGIVWLLGKLALGVFFPCDAYCYARHALWRPITILHPTSEVG